MLVTTAGLLLLGGLVGISCTGKSVDPGGESGGTGGAGGTGSDEGVGGAGGDNGVGGSRGTGGTGGTTVGIGGATGAGGRTGTGGATVGAGGRTGAGGVTGAGGTMIVVPPSCGSTTQNQNPFGCNLAWGMQNPGGSLTGYSYLQFMSFWIGAEVRGDGTVSSCTGCTWITSQVSRTTNIIPVYYAYLIGFYGHANGLPDQNVNPNGANLSTGGANLIRNNRAKIIQLYASYAQQTRAAWGTRPLVWLLEGDFVQYTSTTQANPLSYAELAQLAEDITCAIKANMPNAVVAINHSTWNADAVTNLYWAAMRGVNYDMTWTSGAGNANGFFVPGAVVTDYNGKTATYAYLHSFTGKTTFVDTSFGLSAAGDSWSNAGAANLNARIASGVVAVNVTSPASNYASNIAAAGTLSTTCAP